MSKKKEGSSLKGRGRLQRIAFALIGVLLSMCLVSTASAFNFELGCPGWQGSWDNTLQYSAGFRLLNPRLTVADRIGPNGDDGDLSFRKGLISSQLYDFSQLDIRYEHQFGFRGSAAGWLDPVYLINNDNNSPATFNGLGANDSFPGQTKFLSGAGAMIYDAFIWDRTQVCNMPFSFRLGRHTIMWGQSLFFASNGIAYGQSPINILDLLSNPDAKSQDLFLPVGQFSAQLQVTPNVAVLGFMDFEWRRGVFPPSDSYFSPLDFIDAGGQRLFPGAPLPPGGYFLRGQDLGAGGDSLSQFGEGDFGQGGMGLTYHSNKLDSDFGLYAYRYNEKSPYWVYAYPGQNANPAAGNFGQYALVFPEGIEMVGASLGTDVGPVSVGAEVSARINTPLLANQADMVVLPGMKADNHANPLYPIGNTLHGVLNGIWLLPPGPLVCGNHRLWDGGDILGEIAWQYLINITKNKAAFESSRDRYATALRILFEPTWYQVYPGMDLTIPIGFGYCPAGNSPVDAFFNGDTGEHAGDFEIGMKFNYNQTWIYGFTYTNYFGNATNQAFGDRDFVSVYVRRTF